MHTTSHSMPCTLRALRNRHLGLGDRPFSGKVDRGAAWQRCVPTVLPGFEAVGAELEPVMSYTDANCMRCGSCLQGCPTNAGKSTLNTYIHPPWVQGSFELRADCDVRRVTIENRGDGPEATGVEYIAPDGRLRKVEANVVFAHNQARVVSPSGSAKALAVGSSK